MCNAETLLRGALLGAAVLAGGNAAAATPSQAPLFLVEGVSPNLIVTLDDSGSMTSAYTPDGMSSYTIANRSASYNPMYYNPAITYEAPWKVTFSGGRLISERYTTQFDKAYYDGFLTLQTGTLDLNRYTGNGYGQNSIQAVNTTDSYKQYAHYYQFDAACPHARNVATNALSAVQNCATDYSYTNANACTKSCFAPRWVTTAEEKQNYANWFSFYRTRQLATRTAANLALFELPDHIRVTWQGLNSCYNTNFNLSSSTCGNQTLAAFADQHKADFFTFTSRLVASGGTPLGAAQNRVNSYLSSTSAYNPYARAPGATRDVKTEYACRPTYHLLMTDGFGDGSGGNNADGTTRTLPDGKAFAASAPFYDKWSNTLADNIFLGWATDARADLENKVPPRYRDGNDYWNPKNDPATWQHVTTYTVGLGLGPTLKYLQWGGDTYSGSYPQLLDGSKSWPNPSGSTVLDGMTVTANEGKVAALWHGALNARGEFFSADSTSELVQAFQAIVSSISTNQLAVAAAGASSTSLSTDTYLYRASYQPNDWSGDILQYRLDADGNAQANTALSFRNQLDQRSPGSRNLYFNSRPDRPSGSLQAFAWDNLATSQQDLLDKAPGTQTRDHLGQRRLAWLRGDRSDEDVTFRARNHLLGDIIYSSPVVVGAPSSVTYYLEKAARTTGYETFRQDHADRERRIYVGANDGMLHAFDETGRERWAFIPAAVVDKLNYLPAKNYAGRSEEENTNNLHRFFVDGTAVTQDVYFDGAWRTVLVMAPGRGGRGLFALDITDPDSPALLWEHTARATSRDGKTIDFGYLLERPVITSFDGEPYILTGNGYDAGKGYSLSIRLADGRIDAASHATGGDGDVASTVAWTQAASPGELAQRYYGSLQGNLYRQGGIDAKASLLASLASARGQAVSAAPEVTQHPRGGQLVLAGTGKYFEGSDKEGPATAQSLYGFWDQTDYLAHVDGAGDPATLTRLGDLQKQTLTEETVSHSGGSTLVRQLSSDSVSWDSSGKRGVGIRGWYFDLADSEMILDQPFMLGDVLFVTVSKPNADPCSAGITYWLLAVNPKTGGALNFNVFDLAGDGSFSERASGIQIEGPVTRIGGNLYTPDGSRLPVQLFDPVNQGRFNWQILNFNLPTGYP
ncbi:pilus assembly protein [Pseudomonas nitroreducens]|uniref:pilus assembly protein n=1 Tax=Pseudomonas nitroreducens TaxID=46680 RepID=UPI0009FFB50F|nr:PilC/PilY family type IV pilus protein [Pseudomonas nitroreducens]NMZ62053.1 PQQ-binding-like beta-propeller repeat protein [Pseudomonas nitroreducens]SNT22719.1 type IV pilus assembly protein PilY1 [Pseudomonas nitroreducens]